MPAPALDLDAGSTVPTTAYTIPASNVIYLSTTGNDANPGTSIGAPKRTLWGTATTSGAYSAVPVNGTIVVRGGVYEEGSVGGSTAIPLRSKACTIQAYAGEQVWFDGSVVVSNWQGSGPWTKTGWSFNPGDTSTFTSDKPTSVWWFDQLFLDGVPLTRVAGTPTTGQFSVNHTTGTITLGSNPTGREVRMSQFRSFAVFSARVNLRGIGVRRYANGSGSSTGGASGVYYGGTSAGATIEDCAFVDHASNPLSVAKSGFTIRRNIFARSGKTHVQVGGSTGGDGLTFTENLCVRSNRGLWPAEPTSGAVKIVKTDVSTVTDNTIAHAPGTYLLWFDQTCTRATVARNDLHSISGAESKTALLFELSGGGLLPVTGTRTQYWSYIVDNIVYGTPTYSGLTVLDSDWTKIWNNTWRGRDRVVEIRQDSRPPSNPWTGTYNVGALDFLTSNLEFCNNDIGPADGAFIQFLAYNSDGVHTSVSANTMFSKLSGNWWQTPSTRSAVQWGETGNDGRVTYTKVAASEGAGALDLRSNFVANGWTNFRGTTRPAAGDRETVPSDVAALLRQSTAGAAGTWTYMQAGVRRAVTYRGVSNGTTVDTRPIRPR